MELSETRVAIWGLGLMGGSLAQALSGKCAGMDGVDRDPQTVETARQSGIFAAVSRDPQEVLPNADLVILAAPVCTILELLAQLPALHPGSPVVLDLGSTKRRITEAMASLPERFDPLGGHPMCGKEQGGWANAEADLFVEAPFAFTALPRTTERARGLAEQLARAVEARPLWLEAEVHDRWTAATSHLPYLVASALALATPGEAAPLVGPGLRSTTRVAATAPEMMLDILRTNPDNILQGLGRMREELDHLEGALRQGDWADLAGQLSQAAEYQRVLAQGRALEGER